MRFFHGGVLEVTSRELKIFCVGVEAFSCWLRLLWVVENDVFLVDWIFFGGRKLIFFQRLKVFQGMKFIPSELSFLSGCSRFSRLWEVYFFFLGRFNFF